MLFEGVFGTGCSSRGLLDAAAGEAWFSVDAVVGLRGVLGTDLAAVPDPKPGSGGGNGDIDMEVTEAEWAWYTRKV